MLDWGIYMGVGVLGLFGLFGFYVLWRILWKAAARSLFEERRKFEKMVIIQEDEDEDDR